MKSSETTIGGDLTSYACEDCRSEERGCCGSVRLNHVKMLQGEKKASETVET